MSHPLGWRNHVGYAASHLLQPDGFTGLIRISLSDFSHPDRSHRRKLKRFNFKPLFDVRVADYLSHRKIMRTIRALENKTCIHKANRRTARFPAYREAQSQEGENIMKRTHRLTLIALATLFVVTVAVLLASAPAKVSAQTKSTFGPLAFLQGLFQAPWRGFATNWPK